MKNFLSHSLSDLLTWRDTLTFNQEKNDYFSTERKEIWYNHNTVSTFPPQSPQCLFTSCNTQKCEDKESEYMRLRSHTLYPRWCDPSKFYLVGRRAYKTFSKYLETTIYFINSDCQGIRLEAKRWSYHGLVRSNLVNA